MTKDIQNDKRIVMTLDAGGTNFVFSAMRGGEAVVSPIRKDAHADQLKLCLNTIVQGFGEVRALLDEKPVAISFAFPGPADYKKGIIGDLPNFGAFRGGVPLGPMLEEHFGIPVYINNDGNLFAFGEALAGYLPWLNNKLVQVGSKRSFENLVGFTLGTGFGSGLVLNETMILGHSTSGAEIHNTLNAFHPDWNAEEGVSTRAIQRVYAENAALDFNAALMPKDIYNIAKGKKEGHADAALESFRSYGRYLGNSIANTLSLFDGIVVLGGGIAAAWELFAPAMFLELGREYKDFRGNSFPRLSYPVFNLEDESQFQAFSQQKRIELPVPGSDHTIGYDMAQGAGVALSFLGASKAISIGAYAYALQQLDITTKK